MIHTRVNPLPRPTDLPLRLGAVRYLNSKPLIEDLPALAPSAELTLDVPSRLADDLSDGRLDVALIPSVEAFLDPDYQIVSDACVATHGPVMSVKVYFRTSPGEVRTLGCDEGSRTSVALSRILLAERFGTEPRLVRFPLGAATTDSTADAILVIGDRAMHPPAESFVQQWDLGQEWLKWTGLPFVFAMWVARDAASASSISPVLEAARDLGVARLDEIAAREAGPLGLPVDTATNYLKHNLHFQLGSAEKEWTEAVPSTCGAVGNRTRAKSIAILRRDGTAAGGDIKARTRRPVGCFPIRSEKAFLGRGAAQHPSQRRRRIRGTTEIVMTRIDSILDRVVDGERLSTDDALTLLESHDLAGIGRAANAVTNRLHPESYRTYNIDRNINYSNVCAAVCDFCASTDRSAIPRRMSSPMKCCTRKFRRRSTSAVIRFCCKGAAPPTPLEWYEDLLRSMKAKFPQVNIHGFSPPELWHFHKLSKLPLKTVLQRLMDAGLGSLPGGGGEILVDRVRKAITRGKVLTDGWLEVNQAWHELGGKSTCTMMFGHVETLAERVEHLDRLRKQQDESGGFTAFICWTHQPPHEAPWFGHDAEQGRKGGVDMSRLHSAGAFEYLKTQAVARLFLDNIPNIQSSWVTQGEKIGQIALAFGANDMGSLMIEENVVAQAGTVFHLSLETIRHCIRDAGYEPRQRNVFYELLEERPVTTRPQPVLPVLAN
ncbi:MAG: CofH family radical SAM protein [Planctomycetaceae bacterium]